jgi:tRNA(Ile)-lysidine synthase
MIPLAPPPDQIARFVRDVEALGLGGERLGLAVSGGPDSLALLLLANAAFPGRVEAATVDHGLRRESAIEALHVEDICDRIGCPHTILNVTVEDGAAGVQAEARRARYEALSAWAAKRDIAHLATAHHADDQAETVLMRLQRGSGVAGLSGIRPRRREGPLLVLRPLLGWTKAELVHLVSRSGVEAVEDPSNQDMRFDRAAMRRFLSHNPQFQPQRLSRTAAAMREAEEALAWTVEQLAEDRITSAGGEWRIEVADLPHELKRRLLIRTVAEIRLEAGLEIVLPRGEELEGLIDTMEAGGTGSLAAISARGGTAWLLRLAPPRRPTRS